MAFRETGQPRRVMDYMAKGKLISAGQARNWFGVKNLRAVISYVKATVEEFGNHKVYRTTTATGKTAYGMNSH